MCFYWCFDIEFKQLISLYLVVGRISYTISCIVSFALKDTFMLPDLSHPRYYINNASVLSQIMYQHTQHQHPI